MGLSKHCSGKSASGWKRHKPGLLAACLLGMALCLLPGCQKTPEEAFVAGKDTNAMLAKAASPAGGQTIRSMTAPAAPYRYSFVNEEDTLRIQVDAEVLLPVTETLPVIAVQDCGFDQALVSSLFNYVFPDEKPYLNTPRPQTKEDIEYKLNLYAEILAARDFSFYEEHELAELIDAAQARYAEAPWQAELPPLERTDGEMIQETEAGLRYYALSCQLPEEGEMSSTYFYARSYGREAAKADWNISYMESQLQYVTPYVDPYFVEGLVHTEIHLDYQDTIPPAYTDSLLIPFTAAKEKCEELLQTMNQGDTFQLHHISLLGNGEGQYGLSLIYTRQIGGFPSALISQSFEYGTAGPYASPWGYEFLQFLVDDRGIIRFEWNNPIEETQVLVKDARLLPFEDVVPAFERAIRATYEIMVDHGGQDMFPAELDVQVNAIQLALLRIRAKDAVGRVGLAVPAWLFYGHVTRSELIGGETYYLYDPIGNTAMSIPCGPMIVMAINAIDGSVIDMSCGY